MSTITSITRVSANAVQIACDGEPPFEIYVDGVVIAQTEESAYIVEYATSEPPSIEVRASDDTGDPLQVTYSPRAILQWRGDLNAERYRIERYEGSAWVVKGSVAESGLGYYQYETEALRDGTAYPYRVIAVDGRGYESDAAAMTVTPVTLPPVPVVGTVTYNEGTGALSVAVT